MRPIRILAIASAGGHWVQLRRLRPAWSGCDVAYATSDEGLCTEVAQDPRDGDLPAPRFHHFPEASRWHKFRLLWQLCVVLVILVRERPDVVVSTGASAGYFAIRLAKAFNCRTIWVDSMANSAELSLAGRRAGPHADLWLTQWAHLAGATAVGGIAPAYMGQVL